jgi:hypothetical protein
MHLPEAVGRASAGVEFWVQRLERDNEMSAEGPEAENWGAQARLPFHFDKDEEALRSTEQWHHPSCATVTYLTDPRSGDPPTVICDSVHPDAAAQRGVAGCLARSKTQPMARDRRVSASLSAAST